MTNIDALNFIAWGILLLRYWLTGEIKLLIHPNYIGLVLVTGVILIFLGSSQLFEVYKNQKKKMNKTGRNEVQHVTLFPGGWSTFFLTITVILGFLIPPKVLGSEVALQRGIREALPLTQTQPEQFRVNVEAIDRSLIDWIKTINAYPEPDAYQGEAVKVRGFVIRKQALEPDYFLLAQFIITCCAIDAYPVALPVKLESIQQQHEADTWLEIEGEMMTETLSIEGIPNQGSNENRQLVIRASKIKEIPTPRNPYGY